MVAVTRSKLVRCSRFIYGAGCVLALIALTTNAQQPNKLLVKTLTENRVLRAELQEIKAQNEALKRQLHDLRTRDTASSRQLQELRETVERLKAENESARKQNAELREQTMSSQELQDPSKQNIDLQERIQSLSKANDALLGQVKTLQEANSELSAELKKLREQNVPLSEPKKLKPPESYAPSDKKPDKKPAAVKPKIQQFQSDASLKETDAYNRAMQYLGKNPSAVRNALGEFLAKYGSGRYSGEVNFWLAESYYETAEYKEAERHYERVVKDFPQSDKINDARLKLAYIYYETRQWGQARQSLSPLLKSEDKRISRLAEKRLQRMEREGH